MDYLIPRLYYRYAANANKKAETGGPEFYQRDILIQGIEISVASFYNIDNKNILAAKTTFSYFGGVLL